MYRDSLQVDVERLFATGASIGAIATRLELTFAEAEKRWIQEYTRYEETANLLDMKYAKIELLKLYKSVHVRRQRTLQIIEAAINGEEPDPKDPKKKKPSRFPTSEITSLREDEKLTHSIIKTIMGLTKDESGGDDAPPPQQGAIDGRSRVKEMIGEEVFTTPLSLPAKVDDTLTEDLQADLHTALFSTRRSLLGDVE